MNIDRLSGQYWFHEGAVKSFYLDVQNSRVEIEMSVRRILRKRDPEPLRDEDLEPCTLKLTFDRLIKVSLFDRFPTQGYFIEMGIFNHGNSVIEMSFTIHDSSSYVYEKYNWVIKAKKIAWKEV